MASLAGFAPTEARETRGPSPWIAALLTLLTPGLGHIYIGQARRGITLFVLVLVADVLVMFSLMGVLARFWMFAISLGLLLGLWLFIMIDATVRAALRQEYPQYSYNKWPVYAGAFVVACLLTAIPCSTAPTPARSVTSGFFARPPAAWSRPCSMANISLRNSTYYRSHQPSRGDVAVYVHPMEAGRHYIKRIAAVEGDRIAVRAGRAVVERHGGGGALCRCRRSGGALRQYAGDEGAGGT